MFRAFQAGDRVVTRATPTRAGGVVTGTRRNQTEVCVRWPTRATTWHRHEELLLADIAEELASRRAIDELPSLPCGRSLGGRVCLRPNFHDGECVYDA